MQKCISDQFTSAPSTVRCSASRPHPVGVRGSGEGGGPPRTPPRPNQKKCYLVCRFKLLPGLPVAHEAHTSEAEGGASEGVCDVRTASGARLLHGRALARRATRSTSLEKTTLPA